MSAVSPESIGQNPKPSGKRRLSSVGLPNTGGPVDQTGPVDPAEPENSVAVGAGEASWAGVSAKTDAPGAPSASALPDAMTGPQLELQMRQLGSKLKTLHYQIVTCAAAYDNSGRWAKSGHRNCANWISEQLDVCFGTAREWLRVGHVLAYLPSINESFASGVLSYSKVRMVTRIAGEHPDRDEELRDLAEATPIRELAVKLAQWCDENEDEDEGDKRRRKETNLSCRIEPDGMGTIIMRLPAVEYAKVMAAIDSQVRSAKRMKDATGESAFSHFNDSRAPLGRQRANALVKLTTDGGAKVRTEVIVHVRGDGTRLDNGVPINANLIAQLLPQSTIRAMIHDAESKPINVSGRHRHPTERQKLVVSEREPACACGSTVFLDCHHEPPFDESKRTVIDELEMKCGNCHRIRHQDERRRNRPT